MTDAYGRTECKYCESFFEDLSEHPCLPKQKALESFTREATQAVRLAKRELNLLGYGKGALGIVIDEVLAKSAVVLGEGK